MKLESIEEISCFNAMVENTYMLPLFVTSLGPLLLNFRCIASQAWFQTQ